jgi:monoterpene epsilon-lactone hydrolase
MTAQELRTLVEQIRSGPISMEVSPAEIRTTFDGSFAALSVAEDVTVQDVRLGGSPALQSSDPGADLGRTLFYLHGGGYVAGSPTAYRTLWSGLASAAGARGLAPSYRLAPEHPFPAALEDAVSAYAALLEQGTDPGDVAVAGDSAGGGLAVAMLVSARDRGLPMPSSLTLLSPWTDLACTGASMEGKAAADPSLTPTGLRLRAADYLAGHDAHDPLASPVVADLSGLPPMLIQVGTAEVLLDDATRLAARAAACDVRTTLEIWPDMVHVFAMFGFALSEGRQVIDDCGAFVRSHFRK